MAGRLPEHRVRVALNLQDWQALTFLHWPVEPAALRPLLPPGLEVDTFDGAGWVGVTPFWMRRVRVPGAPVPLVPDFVEVNVRTYVRGPDGHDGLWFLSLDCGRLPVVGGLRLLGLPYRLATASAETTGTELTYTSRRRAGGAAMRARVRAGAYLPEQDALTQFLTGRWNAYSRRVGRLWRFPVEHEPWPLHAARAEADVAGLLAADHVPVPAGEPLAHVAPLVHARIGPPVPA